ncbi:HEAT repeat-containing protein 3 [Gryllus bimaculatus]|nr:HEAT repeat-containing protein 3 [Gryllus bimaculatus]
MGKTRHFRRKHKDTGPTGLPSVKDIEKEEQIEGNDSDSASASDVALQNIVDQGPVEDKVFALHSLASIFYTAGSVQDVVRQKVARIAGPLLLDPSSAVRNAAAGALRNLTSSGNHEICDLLIEQDIMTPVSAFFLKCADVLPSKPGTEDSDTFAQAVYLLWNFEGNSTAVQYFNDRNLMPILVKFISAAPENWRVTLAIVQCLITVVEDNSHACNLLQKSEEVLNNLLTMNGDSTGLLLLRVMTAGILLRVRSNPSDILGPVVLDAIVSPLLQDQRKKLNELSSTEPGESDGDDEAMDLDSNSTSSDGDICEETLCEPETNLEDLTGTSLSLSPEIHEVIVSKQLVPKIWEKTRTPAENVRALLHEHSGGQHILNRVDILRSRAFSCLNNIIPVLDIQDMGGPENLFQMWLDMATCVVKNEEPDPDVLEAASCAMRAALQKFAQNPQSQSIDIQLQQIEFIFTAAPNPKPCVRANVVRTVGMLGMMTLSQPLEKNFEIIKGVGKFLLNGLAHELELWVMAEMLDSIMDLFGEDETDRAAAELALTIHLQTVLPAFKRRVKMNRKKLGDHYALVTTVNTNLPRFIRYKSKRLSVIQTTLE